MDDVASRQEFPWPAVALYLLSPVVAELLTSSSSPLEFFTPFGLTVMCLLYGSGALLVRELSVRWKAGWPGRFALGVAFGIVEEGLMVKSFFDPGWPDIGVLGGYGRLWGVNWVWSLEITVFHCLFSICIPILLVELIAPRWRERAWLGTAGLVVFPVLLAADVAFGARVLTSYRPPAIPYLGALAVAAALVVASRRLRGGAPVGAEVTAAPTRRRRGALPFFLLGLVATPIFFVLNWIVPNTPVPPMVTMALVVVLVAGFFLALRALMARRPWAPVSQWALASGALGFFVVLAPLVARDGSRRDDPRGMGAVGLVMAALLLAGCLVVRGRDRRLAAGRFQR